MPQLMHFVTKCLVSFLIQNNNALIVRVSLAEILEKLIVWHAIRDLTLILEHACQPNVLA